MGERDENVRKEDRESKESLSDGDKHFNENTLEIFFGT